MDLQRKLPQFQGQRQRQRKPESCKITTKKKKDGSFIKEISGNCSHAQLEALKNTESSETE